MGASPGLHLAACRGDLEALAAAASARPADLSLGGGALLLPGAEEEEGLGRSLLASAAMFGRAEAVQLLLEAEAGCAGPGRLICRADESGAGATAL
eukprot:COSAG01_NODE_12762_length_1689_cov_2.485535_1_plen_96_part_00